MGSQGNPAFSCRRLVTHIYMGPGSRGSPAQIGESAEAYLVKLRASLMNRVFSAPKEVVQ